MTLLKREFAPTLEFFKTNDFFNVLDVYITYIMLSLKTNSNIVH